MRKELDEALVRDFPSLYRDRHGDMRRTCMVWGFPGDGWEPIIRRLSEKLEPMGVIATQVKEKFGGLRFYIDQGTDEAYAAIDEAERESYRTCEECGQPGKPRQGGWIVTVCDLHAEGNPPHPDFGND